MKCTMNCLRYCDMAKHSVDKKAVSLRLRRLVINTQLQKYLLYTSS